MDQSHWREQIAAQRGVIDGLDSRIIELLNQRVHSALKVGEAKKELGLPLHDPDRERAVYQHLEDLNRELGGILTPDALRSVYREIISVCLQAEHPTTVAFLGPAGTNTQEAAVRYFGSAFTPLPCANPDEVCQAVARGAAAGGADYGVVAIENSIHGVVSSTLDLLTSAGVSIYAEIELVIHHCLLSNTALDRITTVYSHEQALAQCRSWLASHLPSAHLIPVTSTARGAEMAMQENGAAAIGSALAGGVYGLQLAARNIEDLTNNKTRFFVITPGEPSAPRTGRDKTSLVFHIPNQPGTLLHVLEAFYKHGVNMSMIQSRPDRQEAWAYRFFADLDAHRLDESLAAALEELQQMRITFKVLGSYSRTI